MQIYPFRNNSAEIYVYYNHLTYSTLEQVANTQFVEMLSDIGGSSGLWIGCTVVSLGELLLIAIQSILWCLCCRWVFFQLIFKNFIDLNYPKFQAVVIMIIRCKKNGKKLEKEVIQVGLKLKRFRRGISITL